VYRLILASLFVGALPFGGTLRQQDDGDGPSDAVQIEPLWRFPTSGQIWSSAVQEGGVLYFGSDDNCLYALDASGGELRWRFATGGRVRSTPVLEGERIYFTSDDGFLYALNRGDGSAIWRFDLDCAEVPRVLPSPHPPLDYDYLLSSPLLVEGVLHVGSANGSLYAVDCQSGEEKWRFESGGRIRSTPRADEESIFIGSWDGHVYCLDRSSGLQRWSFDTHGILQASPTIAEGRVFIGSRNPKIFALDARTGELEWEFVLADGSWVESTGVVLDGVLYIGSSDSLTLFALDAESGEVLMKFRTGGWSWGTPAVHEDAILIGSVSAHPYYFPGVTLERGLWALDPVTAEPMWHLPTAELPGYLTGGVFATPLILDGIAYFGSLDGGMYAVELVP
jgi:outer membrane protein assembly factor BamB